MTPVKKSVNRKICTVAEDQPLKSVNFRSIVSEGKPNDITRIFKTIDDNIVGRNTTFLGPYGRRKVIYSDYAASGRAVQFIEEYINKDVLPLCGDIRTSVNVTAHQSSLFRQEACDIVRHSVNASNDDIVLFTGSSRNSSLEKLIRTMDIDEPPIVFVGSSEHPSLLLPWMEICAKIVRIAETKEGFIDLVDLENKLQKEMQLLSDSNSHPQFIGCFSAASDITGILADDIATTVLLHQFNAFSFWDYSTAAPYVPLDMNPLLPGNDKGVHKDAIFFSGYRFIGGIQSSSVLVAKKQIFRSEILEALGSLETSNQIQNNKPKNFGMLKDTDADAIVDIVRMGLTMHLKESIGSPNILIREQKIAKTVLSFARTIPEIILLGNGSHSIKRLPVLSFIVRHPRGLFLHHNFVCAVLNDVFGIQACGGCACTGQYAHDLLGISSKLANLYEDILTENKQIDCGTSHCGEEHFTYEILRPGFTRISLPYFISDAEVTFILEAVKMVATEGWRLLPQYVLYPEIGEWKHRTNIVFRERKCLSSFRFVDGKMVVNERKISGQSPFPQDPADCLQMARNIFNKARKMAHRYPLCDQRIMFSETADKLRWFMLPSEAQNLLLGNCQSVKITVPFLPGEYKGTRNNSLSSINSSSDSIHHATKSFPSMLDVSSIMCARHNSLTSFETGQLKRSTSFFVDKACSDCGFLSPAQSNLRREASPMSRTRCYSLESSSASPPSRLFSYIENGHCSCGSQTDISDADSNSKDHLADFGDMPDMGINTLFPSSQNENIKAYVKGVTEELATEIKTEIREVIATVDNVLSESMESLDQTHSCSPYEKRLNGDFKRTSSISSLTKSNSPQYSMPNSNENEVCGHSQNSSSSYLESGEHEKNYLKRQNSFDKRLHTPNCDAENVSDHVAEYLAELTSEMVTEMKSELREMVNAVDEIISPSLVDKNTINVENNKKSIIVKLDEEGGWDSDKSQSLDEVDKETAVKHQETKTLNKSDSSSDSGVADMNSKSSPTKTTKRKISVVTRETKSVPNIKDQIIESEVRLELEVDAKNLMSCSVADGRKRSFENVVLQPKWHCPPKNVWKPTVEAIREFDMIREGDRILICVSGGKDSLSLLHTLHQYQYYSQSYGITFTFGVITIDPENTHYNPRPLIPYFHALGVTYLYEKQRMYETTESVTDSSTIYKCRPCIRLRSNQLSKIASDNNFNVIALGQHFDDVAENFFVSIFHQGKLRSMKAHYKFKGENEIRVIRPFIHVREKHLRQFADNRKFPIVSDYCPTCFDAPKEQYRTKQLLAQQEILYPKLFCNIKSALQPLISSLPNDEEASTSKTNTEGGNFPIFALSDNDEHDKDLN